ncbi:MAG: tetratricopeptide repeat protein [Treponema sp.]|nr:tetratricopeptide repeat protein [Treponema sp.]
MRWGRFYSGGFFIAVLLMGWFAACSTAPKKAAEIRVQRDGAEKQLELANQQAERGDFDGALALLEMARQLAVTADDPYLRVRTALSRGNVFFYQGKREEAVVEWVRALAEAEAAGDVELVASARIYSARGRLLSAIAEGNSTQAAASVKADVSREMGRIKKDRLSIALGWTVIGLAEKESRRFADGEAAVKKALDIHQKGNYLEQAAYDWYIIASIRSMAGNYPSAAAALEEAIALDRRAENSWGLAMDWRALGEVYRKAGRNGEADVAAARSEEILSALQGN